MLHAIFTAPERFTTRPTLRGRIGMAASTHWIATGVAQGVLERGGNAVDAAVAGAFALHVAEPHLNGPGGDLVGLVSQSGDVRVIAGQGPAPAGATLEHMAGEGLESVPGAGALAAAVPGAVPSLLDLLARRGTWELADVLEDAIMYAERGVPASPQLCSILATVEELFVQHWPSSRDTWLPSGRVPQPGDPVRNPVYANTLRSLISAAGAGEAAATREQRIRLAIEEWRSGFVAEHIEDFVRVPHRHADGVDRAGVIRAADLAAYEPTEEAPASFTFRGATIHKSDAWGSGPVLLQSLAILAEFDDAALDPASARGIHSITEAVKLAMADREAFYGDAPGRLAVGELLTRDYARSRAAMITDTASAEWRPGRPAGRSPYVPPLLTEAAVHAAGVGEPTVRMSGETRGDTCHIDVADRWGTMVSLTPSGGWLQSSPTIPGLGFCLGTRLQMTWLDPASPAALAPGRRPRTTLSPSMISVDGRVIEAFGTPGGDQQDQWQLPYVLRRVIGGYEPQQAIDAPTFHSAHLPGSFWPRTWSPLELFVEDRFGDAVIDELTDRGHRVVRQPAWSLGRLSSVGVDERTGELTAAANPRGAQGYAAGR